MSAIQDLSQVAKLTLLVKHFIGIGELLAVPPILRAYLEALAQLLDVVQEPLAARLAFESVQIELLVVPLVDLNSTDCGLLDVDKGLTDLELFELILKLKRSGPSPETLVLRPLAQEYLQVVLLFFLLRVGLRFTVTLLVVVVLFLCTVFSISIL